MEYEIETGVTPDVADQDTGVEIPAAEGATEEAVEETSPKERTYTKAEVEAIVTGRLKNEKARNSFYRDFAKSAASRYGVDLNDQAALKKAFDEDKSYLREMADANGVTEEVQRQLNELNSLKAAQGYEQVKARMAESVREAQEMFPDFDLDAEMENPQFMDLIGAGISPKDAYTTCHLDEIVSGAISYAVNRAQEKTINDIRARGTRPLENGASSQATASAKIDVSKLTPAQMDELEARAARGEIITL